VRLALTFLALGLSACVKPPRQAKEHFDPPGEFWGDDERPRCPSRIRAVSSVCGFTSREVRVWGSVPREGPPSSPCAIRVRPRPEGLVVETIGQGSTFDPLPGEECVPDSYLTGSRHVVAVDDGFIAGYEGPFGGEAFFVDQDGKGRRPLYRGRTLGFSRTASQDVLALVAGRAHLGRGAVLRLDREASYRPRIVAVLPVEPSGVAFDDGGAIVGYGDRFLFRVHHDGRVENVHYVAHDIGRVFSIARASDGGFYLGLDCGVLRLVPRAEAHEEMWWSARDGASGRWSLCM
jgi:hypothetical protein